MLQKTNSNISYHVCCKKKEAVIMCLETGGFSVANMLHIKLTVDLRSTNYFWVPFQSSHLGREKDSVVVAHVNFEVKSIGPSTIQAPNHATFSQMAAGRTRRSASLPAAKSRRRRLARTNAITSALTHQTDKQGQNSTTFPARQQQQPRP